MNIGEYFCEDEDCDGLVIAGLCNQCGYRYKEKLRMQDKEEKEDKTLRICGLAIVVKEVNLSAGHFGEANLEDCEILLNKDLNEDLKRDTLLHEVIHIISNTNALNVSEEQTACLANNLAQFLEDNKNVLE